MHSASRVNDARHVIGCHILSINKGSNGVSMKWQAIRYVMNACAYRGRRLAELLAATAQHQKLTLVHFSAQRKRFLLYRGCVQGLFRVEFRGCLGALGSA